MVAGRGPGANDGIVSVAGLVVGVAGATTDRGPLFLAGIAGVVAGAVSMALGGVRVGQHSAGLRTRAAGQGETGTPGDAEQEFQELTANYQAKGLQPATARQVAEELTDH